MKRIITAAILIIVLATSCIALAACSEKKDELTVVDYEIKSSTYFIGDQFKTSDISVNAKMSDDTTKEVTKNLLFTGDDKESLKLDSENKFTQSGTYKIKVYHLVADDRENNRFFLGEWEIVVKIKK